MQARGEASRPDAAEVGAVASPDSATPGPVKLASPGGAGKSGVSVARRRRRQSTARPHAVFARFSAEGFEDLAARQR